jgi:hypothetical protein
MFSPGPAFVIGRALVGLDAACMPPKSENAIGDAPKLLLRLWSNALGSRLARRLDGGVDVVGAGDWPTDVIGAAPIPPANVSSLKSSTALLHTEQRMSFSPTMLSALVRHAEHSGWLHGLRTARRGVALSQTEHARGGARDASIAASNDTSSTSGCSNGPGPISAIDSSEMSNGSLNLSGATAANDCAYGMYSFSSMSNSCSAACIHRSGRTEPKKGS